MIKKGWSIYLKALSDLSQNIFLNTTNLIAGNEVVPIPDTIPEKDIPIICPFTPTLLFQTPMNRHNVVLLQIGIGFRKRFGAKKSSK